MRLMSWTLPGSPGPSCTRKAGHSPLTASADTECASTFVRGSMGWTGRDAGTRKVGRGEGHVNQTGAQTGLVPRP